jgi:hypothetical protein
LTSSCTIRVKPFFICRPNWWHCLFKVLAQKLLSSHWCWFFDNI